MLLLSSSCLDARRAIALGQYVAAGEAALQPGCPELSVPVATTVWTIVHEQGGWDTRLLLRCCCLVGCLLAEVLAPMKAGVQKTWRAMLECHILPGHCSPPLPPLVLCVPSQVLLQ